MKQNEKYLFKLREALAAAYRAKENTEIGDSWQAKTMRRIRHLGPFDPKTGYLINFEQLLWRLAPVACVLISIFFAYLFNMDFAQEYEIAKLFVDDPIGYAYIQTLGL